MLITNLFDFILSNNYFYFFNSSLIPLIQINLTNFLTTNIPPITLIYQLPFSNLTLISIIFLLITLISIIKSSMPKIKFLRKIN